ncbi:hypothetical protein [Cellulomonas marina]|uniref:hypothetical protein n=1 Tax=Cellulomonas marina TaxID=988821 RepID=UPI000B7D804F|nr:hypothetical protein [Cellulomonas marina]
MPESLLPRLPADDPEVRSRHLLAVPDGVGIDEVETLAASRFVGSGWSAVPEPARGRRPLTTALRVVGPRTLPVRALRLGRSSRLVGPYRLEPAAGVILGLPEDMTVAWVVHAPRERGGPPGPGGDREGLRRAFPTAAPVREEERVLRWLVDAARRLTGAVRTAEEEDAGGVVLVPDPDAAVDLTVLTSVWVEPDDLRRLVDATVTAPLVEPPTGPPPPSPVAERAGRRGRRVAASAVPDLAALRAALEEHGVTDAERRHRLLADARDLDAAVLADPPPPTGHGVVVDLDVDGVVAVEVSVREDPPLLVRDLPWAQGEVVAYRVRWEPPDVAELGLERTSREHRGSRSRATGAVGALALAVLDVVGGEIVDEADFVVDPADVVAVP